MCQPDKQKLLGLALSTTSGVPLRYCIKNEILAAAKYWTFQADQLNFHDVHSNQVGPQLDASKFYKFYIFEWNVNLLFRTVLRLLPCWLRQITPY